MEEVNLVFKWCLVYLRPFAYPPPPCWLCACVIVYLSMVARSCWWASGIISILHVFYCLNIEAIHSSVRWTSTLCARPIRSKEEENERIAQIYFDALKITKWYSKLCCGGIHKSTIHTQHRKTRGPTTHHYYYYMLRVYARASSSIDANVCAHFFFTRFERIKYLNISTKCPERWWMRAWWTTDILQSSTRNELSASSIATIILADAFFFVAVVAVAHYSNGLVCAHRYAIPLKMRM